MKLVIARGTFNGLYEWGTGWLSCRTAAKWNAYWLRPPKERKGSIFWRVLVDGDGTPFAVGTGGSAYMHPMGFDIVLQKLGSSISRGREVFPEMDALREMCEECAAECGGLFHMTEPKVVEVDA